MAVRKIKAGYFNSTGEYPSTKMNRMISFESTLERDFYICLDHDPDVDWFGEQPVTIEYKNKGESRVRTYTPDTRVGWTDNAEYQDTLYEIKFRSDLSKNWHELKPKFKAAIHWCKQRDWQFKIVTEVEIRTARLKNLEFLDHFAKMNTSNDDPVRAALFSTLSKLYKCTPSELLAATFNNLNNRGEALPILWRMIYDGSILTDLDQPLTMKSCLYLQDFDHA